MFHCLGETSQRSNNVSTLQLEPVSKHYDTKASPHYHTGSNGIVMLLHWTWFEGNKRLFSHGWRWRAGSEEKVLCCWYVEVLHSWRLLKLFRLINHWSNLTWFLLPALHLALCVSIMLRGNSWSSFTVVFCWDVFSNLVKLSSVSWHFTMFICA